MHNFTYITFSKVKLHTSSRAPRVLPKVTPSSEKSSPKKHGNLSRLAEISRNMRTKKHFLDCPNTAVRLKKSGLADSSPNCIHVALAKQVSLCKGSSWPPVCPFTWHTWHKWGELEMTNMDLLWLTMCKSYTDFSLPAQMKGMASSKRSRVVLGSARLIENIVSILTLWTEGPQQATHLLTKLSSMLPCLCPLHFSLDHLVSIY